MITLLPNLRFFKFLTLLFLAIQIIYCQDCKPFGVRLSFGNFITGITSSQKLQIRFDTRDNCQKSYITIQKQHSSIRKIYCNGTKLTFQNYVTYVHRCSIVELVQGDNIQYMVFGWTGNNSDPQIPYLNNQISYYFPKYIDQFKMVSIADWSYLRNLRNLYKPLDQSFQYLLKYDKIRAFFINGDIAYDLQSNNGQNYQDFLNMLSQVSIKWPLIINPGNHQHRDNNLYILNTSFQTYGLVDKRVVLLRLPWFNFILFDTYQILYKNQPQNVSYLSYRKQLQLSYQSKNLTILSSHYPFRCNGQPGDCQIKHQQMSNFFSAMFQVNVPLYLGAHHHAYERHYPFKSDQTFIKASQSQWKYDEKLQSRKMVSIVEGVAGNDVNLVQSYDTLQNFTAAVSYNITGYGIVRIGIAKLTYSHYTSKDHINPVDYFQIYLERLRKLYLRTQ